MSLTTTEALPPELTQAAATEMAEMAEMAEMIIDAWNTDDVLTIEESPTAP